GKAGCVVPTSAHVVHALNRAIDIVIVANRAAGGVRDRRQVVVVVVAELGREQVGVDLVQALIDAAGGVVMKAANHSVDRHSLALVAVGFVLDCRDAIAGRYLRQTVVAVVLIDERGAVRVGLFAQVPDRVVAVIGR